MSLLRLEQVELAFGMHHLLDKVSQTLQAGDRIGLLGRNGAGKSSLLKLIDGSQLPDGGQIWRTQGLRIAGLAQELPTASTETLYEFVAGGLPETGALLTQYHALTTRPLDEAGLVELQRVQGKLEALDGWQLQQRVDTVLQRLELDPEATLGSLSGGWRRRAALARALVQEPDVLLLDEPTNHLDLAAIEWLEQELSGFRGAIVLVTHDRSFLQQVANQIWELDRGQIYAWRGNYRGFLDYREQRLAAEDKHNSEFDKKLAEEERWIRTGIKARRTRNEGRVRALEQLRATRAQRRNLQGTAQIEIEQADKSGKLVAELEDVSYCIGERTIISHLSTAVMRGDRIGLIGENGSGKTTLLKLILGELQPTSGTIQRGTKLQIAYFDQLRAALDPTKNAIDNVAGGRDFIDLNGKRIHAVGYLNNFLFESARLRTPVGQMSGGEQNRLILAKLFSQPANLLVLDEPTNDLDLETLELLEELLQQFEGTVLLVSHDRSFLDNVVTSTLVFEGHGQVNEYVGGYSDWQRQRANRPAGSARSSATAAPAIDTSQPPAAATATTPAAAANAGKSKLSYKLQRELEALPGEIEALENRIADLTAATQASDFFQQPHTVTEPALAALAEAQQALETCYERWQELDSL